MKKLELVDFLRGWSISAIVLFHLCGMMDLPSIVKTASNFGGAGVHVFILCSGFGLYLSQMRKPLGFGDFIKKRLIRVHFPFMFIVIISFFVPFFSGSYNLEALFANLLFYKMFITEFNNAYGNQMWFVSMIVQFYLAFFLIVSFYSRRGGVKSVFISLVISYTYAVVIVLIGKSELRVWNSFFLQYLWEFILGMYFAEQYSKNPENIKIPRRGCLLMAIVIGMGLTGYMAMNGVWGKMFNDIPSLVGFMSVALFVYSFKNAAINKCFSYINKFSYEWYLVHILVFTIVFHLCGNSIAMGCVAFILSYSCGIGFQKMISKILK